MILLLHIIEILKKYSSKEVTRTTKPMSQKDIWDKLQQEYHMDLVRYIEPSESSPKELAKKSQRSKDRIVRSRLKKIVEYEANLPEDQKTIGYRETIKHKAGSSEEDDYVIERTDFYYKNAVSDIQLKFLIDSIMYGKIFTDEQALDFARKVQGLSGKALIDRTSYVNREFGKQRFQLQVNVLENVSRIDEAIRKGVCISFAWHVYDVVDGKIGLKEINCRTLKPVELFLVDGRYFMHARYRKQEKLYTYSIDLMSDIQLTEDFEDGINEQVNVQYTKASYILKNPYNFSGDIHTYKLRVRKELFSRAVDTFSYELQIIPGTENDETVDVRVRVSRQGLVYWLLHHYDVAELIDNRDKEIESILSKAAETLYARYCTKNKKTE